MIPIMGGVLGAHTYWRMAWGLSVHYFMSLMGGDLWVSSYFRALLGLHSMRAWSGGEVWGLSEPT